MHCDSGEFGSLHYLIRYPTGYRESAQHPMLLLLHGAGGRGRDLSVLRSNPFFCITEQYTDFPFLVFAPQCHTDTWFDCYETLTAFAETMASRPDVDPSRVYVMGASMGGFATWQLGMSRPDLFAAMVPICGGGMYWNAGRMANMGVWAFHGSEDPSVFPEESRKMVDALNSKGGTARLTIYEGVGHNAWVPTFRNEEMWTWLFNHKRQE